MRLGAAEVRWTSRADGDRRSVVDPALTRLHQVHGARVVVVDAPGACDGEEADAAVTAVAGAKLAVFTADCAPVALAADGVIGAVHAGWRGLAAGVVQAAVEEMRRLGAGRIDAALGPCIRAECYEFEDVAEWFPPEVHGVTRQGRPALDVPAAVRAALDAAGVELVHDEGVCTACSAEHYSHRARGDGERQAMVVWM
ncbi:MAG TPA: polyphenol oxidase family protein [Acidimicrobiales bacterium]|nr:polyphenol oxidase family protein [Acidimicrobiales bacterium]